MKAPVVRLHDGRTMPQIGLGVFDIPADKIDAALHAAIAAGYRSFDTAANYGNERDIGRMVRECGVPRSQLFVTTKLWNDEQGYDSTLRAFDASLATLGLDYVDLYLIHWPMPTRDSYVDTWRAFTRIQEEGRVRSIGVSNFLVEHLERLAVESDITPVVNQIELHPLFQQAALREYGRAHDIVTAAWSPFAVGVAVREPVIRRIAADLARTPAQVVLRWHLQVGNVVLPRSSEPSRIASNFDVLDFELSADDMAAIRLLDVGLRVGADPMLVN